jgi:hypothetical protein
MADIRTLKLNLLADVGDFSKGLETAEMKFKNFGEKLDNISGKAALAFGAIAIGAKSTIDAASDLNESMSKTSVVFEDATDSIVEFSKTSATSIGLSQKAALEAASDFAIFGKAAGLTGDDLSAFSTDTLTLAADLASFNNVSLDQAINAIGAGLRGESEPLRQFGVLLSADAVEAEALRMGLEKGTKGFTDQQKVLARQSLIMQQTTIQQGDFARTSEGAANQQRILTAQMEDAKTKIGQGLLPIYQQLIALVVPFSGYMSENADVISKVALVVLGLTGGIVALNYAIKAVTVITTAWSALVKTVTALQVIWNAVLAANPIGLVVIAIGLLIAAFVIAYEKSETFRDFVDGLFDSLKKLGGFIKDTLVGYFDKWVDVIDRVRDAVKKLMDAIGNSAIGKAIGGIIDKVTGGKAVGGMVSAGQAVRVGELGSEVFVPTTGGQIIPNNRLGGGGNTFIFNGVIDGESARRSIEQLLQNSARRTGAVNFVGATV